MYALNFALDITGGVFGLYDGVVDHLLPISKLSIYSQHKVK